MVELEFPRSRCIAMKEVKSAAVDDSTGRRTNMASNVVAISRYLSSVFGFLGRPTSAPFLHHRSTAPIVLVPQISSKGSCFSGE